MQVGDDRRARLKYLGTRLSAAQLRAGGGVPCTLAQGEADCFFGAGVYSDGGCGIQYTVCGDNNIVVQESVTRTPG